MCGCGMWLAIPWGCAAATGGGGACALWMVWSTWTRVAMSFGRLAGGCMRGCMHGCLCQVCVPVPGMYHSSVPLHYVHLQGTAQLLVGDEVHVGGSCLLYVWRCSGAASAVMLGDASQAQRSPSHLALLVHQDAS